MNGYSTPCEEMFFVVERRGHVVWSDCYSTLQSAQRRAEYVAAVSPKFGPYRIIRYGNPEVIKTIKVMAAKL